MMKTLVQFTCKKLIKDAEGRKKPVGMPSWKNKTPEEFNNMCNKADKVRCVLTGRINNITVFDFDCPDEYYKFIKKYPAFEYAFTVKTSKGFHVYTKYNPNYLTTTNTDLGIDIRNDDAIVFGAGTVTDFGTKYEHYKGTRFELMVDNEFYEYVKPKSIKPPQTNIPKPTKSKNVYSTNEPTKQVCSLSETQLYQLCDIVDEDLIDNYQTWFTMVMGLKPFPKVAIYLSKRSKKYANEAETAVKEKLAQDCSNFPVAAALRKYAKASDETKYEMVVKSVKSLGTTQGERASFIYELFSDRFVYNEEQETLYFYDTTQKNWIVDKKHSRLKVFVRSTICEYAESKLKESDKTCEPIFKELKMLEEELKVETNKNLKTNVKLDEIQQNIKYQKVMLEPFVQNDKKYHELIKAMNTQVEVANTVKMLIDLITNARTVPVVFDVNEEQKYNVNFKNGLYDMKKGEFRERTQADYVTKFLDWNYSKDVSQNALEDIEDCFKKIQPDELDRCYCLNYLAYSLTGDCGKQIFKINYGPSASNGKSTELAIHSICFPVYCAKLNRQSFCKDYAKKHKEFIGLIRNPVRLAYMEEIERKKLDSEEIKDFVDARAFPVEVMFGTKEERPLQAKLAVTTNKVLSVETDEGILRRGTVQEYRSRFGTRQDGVTIIEEDDWINNEFVKVKNYEARFEKESYKNAYFHYLLKFYDLDFKIPDKNKKMFKETAENSDDFLDVLETKLKLTKNSDDCVYKDKMKKLFEESDVDWKEAQSRLREKGIMYDKARRCGKDDAENAGKRGVYIGVIIEL